MIALEPPFRLWVLRNRAKSDGIVVHSMSLCWVASATGLSIDRSPSCENNTLDMSPPPITPHTHHPRLNEARR
eukprot:gene628-3941_t